MSPEAGDGRWGDGRWGDGPWGDGPWALIRRAWRHARTEGPACALAFVWRELTRRMRPRDAGERCAERFLRAAGYRVLARNWRSPRDARDEADLVALAPDGREVVLVEVKRGAGPWDALARVDRRKRAVLWRLAGDLCLLARTRTAGRRSDAPLARALARASTVRVDLVAVRGEGSACHVCDNCIGVFERRVFERRMFEQRVFEQRGLEQRVDGGREFESRMPFGHVERGASRRSARAPPAGA